ncbi:MAG TPA: hypothetical protein VKA18_15255 [Alphaproteobacteria bacterium]|nr:hypothetical protein [Alphaproteobacteria bacterium]
MARLPRSFLQPTRKTLQARLRFLAGEHQTRRADAAVKRVLDLLSDENLALEASKAKTASHLVFDCGILEQVWEDPRIFNRRNQLAKQGVVVEREIVVTTYAGCEFSREQLVVKF